MLYPVVDIGSNTVKMAVFDSENADLYTPVCFKSMPLRLIEKREKGSLTKEGIYSLCNAVVTCMGLCQSKGITSPMRLFATASLRGIRNPRQVKKSVEESTGQSIRILSSREEAHYSLMGACAADGIREGLLMDMGGGSTEFIAFSDEKEQHVHSFQYGCVSLNEKLYRYGVSNLQNYVTRKLRSISFVKNNKLPLYLTGGSAKAMITAKKVIYGGDDSVSHDQLYTLVRDLQKSDDSVKEMLASLLRERSEQLAAVVFALYCTLCETDCQTARVVKGGIREGFVREWMNEEKE